MCLAVLGTATNLDRAGRYCGSTILRHRDKILELFCAGLVALVLHLCSPTGIHMCVCVCLSLSVFSVYRDWRGAEKIPPLLFIVGIPLPGSWEILVKMIKALLSPITRVRSVELKRALASLNMKCFSPPAPSNRSSKCLQILIY
jgi:hypothetical protein